MRLQNHSVLQFTHEEMKNNKFNFLDVHIHLNPDSTIDTGVYIKPTDTGLYSSYDSFTPINYKSSIVKTLVTRAIKHSSSWESCHRELDRIRQVMANNKFPQSLVDKIINNKLDKYFDNTPDSVPDDIINFYIQLRNFSTFKSDNT